MFFCYGLTSLPFLVLGMWGRPMALPSQLSYSHYLFQYLQYKREIRVSKLITKSIIYHLTKYVPKKINICLAHNFSILHPSPKWRPVRVYTYLRAMLFQITVYRIIRRVTYEKKPALLCKGKGFPVRQD